MTEEKNTKKLKLSIFEIIWYSLCGLIGLWGLTYIVLGLVAEYIPVSSANNYLLKASNVIKDLFGLGFLGWGLILLGIAAVASTIVLLIYARKVDRDYEKNQRRAARLSRIKEKEAEANPVIDAPVEEK